MTTDRNPFIGPRSFQIGQKLYGRDWEIRTLHSLVLTKRLVLLHSPSGAGKSSLIRAGLWPLLERRFRVCPIIGVNTAPVGTTALVNRYVSSTLQSLDPSGLKDLAGRALADYRAPGDEARPELWIFDQFEEILSLDPTDVEAKRDFFEQVAIALSVPDYPRWALFAMRDDYLGGMEPYLKLLPGGLSSRFRLDLLDAESAALAINGIAEVGGGSFEPDAVATLTADLRKVLVQFADGRIESSEGPVVEPVQLQVVCQWLWDRAALRGTPVRVTRDDVLAPALSDSRASAPADASVIDQALAGYYAGQLQPIAGSPSRERSLRDWFERQLITDRGLRNQIIRDTFGQPVDDETLQALLDAWLIREEPRGGRIWIELAHDRMIRPIQRDNAAWRERHLSPFQQQFEAWRRGGRLPELLLRGAALLRAEAWVREHAEAVLEEEHEYLDKSQQARGQSEREQGTNLQQTGWGVIFAPGTDDAVRVALGELLEYRAAMAGRLYRSLEYRPGESAAQFLLRHGAPAGAPDPEKVPQYLLLVGGPAAIPFEFQYGLDISYAVGRLAFDTPEEYASYARSLMAAESGQVALPRRLAVFAPRHELDAATQSMHETLIKPLLERLGRSAPEWETTPVLVDLATKARLAQLLGGPETPALLFLASHGAMFKEGNPQQRDNQGALICQDWQAPGPLAREHYFGPADLGEEARLLGLVAFLDGAFTGGTPPYDDFGFATSTGGRFAPEPFVSRLAQRLLGHPAGGAMAVIGHVDRPWLTPIAEPTSNVLGVLKRLMDGYTVGAAMEVMNQRYTQLAVWLGELMRPMVFEAASRDADLDRQLQALRTAVVDARNFIVLGDPAARLPIDPDATVPVRPALQPSAPQSALEVMPLPASPDQLPWRERGMARSSVSIAAAQSQPGRGASPSASAAESAVTVTIALRKSPGEGASYSATLRLERPGSEDLALYSSDLAFDLNRLHAEGGSLDKYGIRQYGIRLGELLLLGRPPLYEPFVQARSLALALALPLRIWLELEDAELHALPWEYLHDPREGTPLLMGAQLGLVRTTSLPHLRPVIPRPLVDIRALVAVAGEPGAAREQARRVLAGITVDELDPGAPLTLAALRTALAWGYDILYLIAPRPSATADNLPGVMLEHASGRPAWVSGADLGEALAGLSRPPQLVVLIDVAAGGTQHYEPGSIAPELLRAGVPAVVVIQPADGDPSLDTFLGTLFAALWRDGRIDTAIGVARAAMGESWPAATLYLRSRTTRLFQSGPQTVAITPVQPPKNLIRRPAILERLIAALTAPEAATAALVGPGGAGKSTLAAAALADPRVQASFPEVRLWVSLGPEAAVAEGLRAWIAALGGEAGGALSLAELSSLLRGFLGDRRALLVIDNPPNPEAADPFLVEAPGCVRLIVTRDRRALPAGTALVAVGPMADDEAVRLLTLGLDPSLIGPPADLLPLVRRLGSLPMALQLANGFLRERVVARRQPWRDVLAFMEGALDQQGPAAFDSSSDEGVTATLELSLGPLAPDARRRLTELVIFPEGAPAPMTVVAALWKATAGLEPAAASSLVEELAALSLLVVDQGPSQGPAVRLHQILRSYLARGMADQLPELHDKLLDEAAPFLREPSFTLDPAILTSRLDPYLREYLFVHMVGARRTTALEATVFSNGIDAVTGAYLRPSAGLEDLAERVLTSFRAMPTEDRQWLKALRRSIGTVDRPARPASKNFELLAEAGWGVVLAADGDPAIRSALQPLIAHRARQLGREPAILVVEPGERAVDFLQRSGLAQTDAGGRVPYYLLIAADPQSLSFAFQADLDAVRATGRLHFASPEEYASYAEHLIRYETGASPPPAGQALFWAPEAALDPETFLSANFLVQPLAEQFPLAGLQKQLLSGPQATRASLLAALLSPEPPSLLVAAGHSLGFAAPRPGQRAQQGAMVTAGWRPGQPVPPEALVAARDLTSGGGAPGSMVLAYASYSAGATGAGADAGRSGASGARAAEPAFVAELPRRLLAAGTLAFIGHCGPVTSYPFLASGSNPTRERLLGAYGRALQQLAKGNCVGHALRNLRDSVVLFAASLADDVQEQASSQTLVAASVGAASLVQRWTAWQTARSTVLLGDPAARLRKPDT